MMNVLLLNSGSSSLKFPLLATDSEPIHKNEDRRLCRGVVERLAGEAIAFVIPTDEERLIARDTVWCIWGEPHPS
jgi:acetate kinase